MSEDLSDASEILKSSQMPEYAKEMLGKLLEAFGYIWHVELNCCVEPIGSGSNRQEIDLLGNLPAETAERISRTLSELKDVIKRYEDANGPIEADPLEGYKEFIESIEYMDWENDFSDVEGFKLDILHIWTDNRIDYFRSIQSLKLNKARLQAYKEVESLPLGGPEEVCRTCGLFFYDNLDRHRGEESFYCSLDCQERAKLICIQCSDTYLVGKCKNLQRRIRLRGFCSDSCLDAFSSERQADQRYVSSMKRKALAFKVPFDESITRREVFQKAGGVCYICNSKTHIETSDQYSPLLATVDHIVAWVNGGSHTWENVANCCLRCNIRKKDR